MNSHHESIARVLAGEADPEEVSALLERLRRDPEAAEHFRHLAELDGLLGPALEDDLRRERRLGKVVDAVRLADREGFVQGVERRIRTRQAMRRGLALAATVVVGVFIWKLAAPGEGSDPVLATVERTESLRSAHPVDIGSVLRAGDVLEFDAGLAELRVGEMGTMVIEGPASLRFEAEKRAALTRGRVVMSVTEAGHGYRLETHRGAVIDLGTQFGVSVAEDGEVETHVLEGEVEAEPYGGPKIGLTKGKALRFGDSEAKEADVSAFYTKLPPVHASRVEGIHWAFDEGSGMLSNSVPVGDPLVFHARDASPGPDWTEGVFGDAISLDGRGAYLESTYPGVAGGDPRTVCFWVKVPEDFSILQGFGIVSWGHWRNEGWGQVWQISVNPLEEEGDLGRLRVGLHGGQIIGTSDLRDGSWHHVAVVLYEADQPDIGTHVVVYIDGMFETLSKRSVHKVETRVETATHGVWVGRNVTSEADREPVHGSFFRGELDELSIFRGALSQEEIQSLIDTNRLPE